MPHNPYSPPEAPVADPAALAERPRPKQIAWASWLLWTTVLVGFVSFYVSDTSLDGIPEEQAPYFFAAMIALMLISAGVYLWLIQRMRTGRNWARIALLALLIITISADFLVPGSLDDTAAYVVTHLLDVALQTLAAVMMFSHPGSTWFRPRN